ncbi:MAG: prepilin-type N-terminal cleavage/methylation domain-containing protein [Sedimentisphaerales bacterium]
MYNRKAFTLIELLTVLVIIILLVGILLPSIATVRKMAKEAAQRAQFATLDMALEAFKQDYGDYPDSNQWDGTRPTTLVPYCGAMKLAEAMVGADLKGFNLTSNFERRGFDWTSPWLGMPYPPYNTCGGVADSDCYANNIKSRRMYIQPEKIGINRLSDIYDSDNDAGSYVKTYSPYDPCTFVLCDVFARKMRSGNKTGMPILYYKANTNNVNHIIDDPLVDPGIVDKNIYDSRDNLKLVGIPLPWYSPPMVRVHPMASGGVTIIPGVGADDRIFYNETLDKKTGNSPHNASTYILMSAGADGQYGTSDDIFNGF